MTIRKRFLHVVPNVPYFTGAYLPPRKWGAACSPLFYWRLEAKRAICTLAHRVLKRWGRPVDILEDRVDVVDLPQAQDVIERIRVELDNRRRTYAISPKDLALVCGVEFKPELDRAIFASPHFNEWDRVEHYAQGGMLFGMPIVLTPWLAADEFVILPLEYLRRLAKTGYSARPVGSRGR